VDISNKIKDQMTQGSWVRRMFESGIALKNQYGEENVFDLSLGNPIMEPPAQFSKELLKLAKGSMSGIHRYMPNAGYIETRTAVANQLAFETGLQITANQIVMTCGAGGALNVIFKAIINKGEEVIIFAPFFVEYVYYIDNHGGIPKILETDSNYVPNLDKLERAINSKTKAVLINSPNNPTGVVYSDSLMKELGSILGRKEKELGRKIFLVSDEPYKKIVYDNIDIKSVFTYHTHSIVATSYSKDLALPGERIGYIAVNPDYSLKEDLVDAITFCNRTLGFVNAPAMMQHLIIKLQNVTVDVSEYEKKRDILYNDIKSMGYSVVKPQGAFYMFPKSPIEDDVKFVNDLQRYNLLVVPGLGFGKKGHFRISYCVSDRTIKGALTGFRSIAVDYGLIHK